MKHAKLIAQMNLNQKAALLSGLDMWHTKPIPELGVPSILLADGPHGVRKQEGKGDHLGLNGSRAATCFPTAAALANSWDEQLLARVGQAIGEEAAAQGVDVLLGPGLNIKRSPLGGRNFEYYSEDPYLSGKLAAAFIRGVQSTGTAACAKHFAANSQELLRMNSDSVVDERTLRELYLTNFEIAVKEGKPRAVMSSYNKLNGVYANENPWLLTHVLREEWGYDGAVVTDWGGSNDHTAGVMAGSTLEMPGTRGESDRQLLQAVKNGTVEEAALDARVDELLELVLSARREKPPAFDEEGHHALARQAAGRSMVLLKNDGGLLPLSPGARVAVLGDLAFVPRYQGAGSSMVEPTRLDQGVDALRERGLTIAGLAHGYRRDGKRDGKLLREGLEMARRADIVLLWLGLPESAESEGMDRGHMKLPQNQVELLHAVAQVNSKLIVVLSGGSAVETPWLDQCKALVLASLAGQAGVGGVADVLTGRTEPTGRLAESWPLSLEDTPNFRYFPGKERTAQYRESLFVGYRYYQTAKQPVRFPFGFGLGYTTFAYDGLSVSDKEVSFTVTNTGHRPGAEVAQLYISLPGGRVFRPIRELKGFVRAELAPGQQERLTIPLDDKVFRYFNVKTGGWEIEGGRYEISVGASAADIRLSAPLDVEGSDAPPPYDCAELPAYFSGKVSDVPDEQFSALLGRPLPPAKWDRTAPLEWNDTLAQLIYAKGWAARTAGRLFHWHLERSLRSGTPDLNLLFVSNLPFRGMVKLTGGMINERMARGGLTMANGHFFRGLGGFLAGLSGARKKNGGN